MNTEKNTLRTRAANLFAAEERTQELMGLALLQQGTTQTLNGEANASTNRQSLEALVLDSDHTILDIHQRLQHARGYAAQLQAEDKQLAALNQLVYGANQPSLIDENIIEGEIIAEVHATKNTVTD